MARGRYLSASGEDMAAADHARGAARCATAVGIADVSTLGKIDVQGPDAALFLDRIYCNAFSSLAVGRRATG